MNTHMTLREFTTWHSAPEWQLADFEEHCVDNGTAPLWRPVMCWLRDFKELTALDDELFDAGGGGEFAVVEREVGR